MEKKWAKTWSFNVLHWLVLVNELIKLKTEDQRGPVWKKIWKKIFLQAEISANQLEVLEVRLDEDDVELWSGK